MSSKNLLARLVEMHGLDKEEAELEVRAGRVLVDGKPVLNPASDIDLSSHISVQESKKYVGRGAYKLLRAVTEFGINCRDLTVADVGSSTGGFTQVLLEQGAKKVYAIDVGYGELDYKLRVDEKVVVMERTNARLVEMLPDIVDGITADLSFISLKKVLPNFYNWLKDGGWCVLLVKPQFELRKEEVAKGGIVTDPALHQKAVQEVRDAAIELKFTYQRVVESPIKGAKGNTEFLLWLTK